MEVEQLVNDLEQKFNFTEEFGQERNDSVKDAFTHIDERPQINDTYLHETMATSQAFGNNTSKGRYGCCYNFDTNEIDYERTMNNLTKRYNIEQITQ